MIRPEQAWPMERLGEALDALAQRAGLAERSAAPVGTPALRADEPATIDQWMHAAGAAIGVEVIRTDLTYADVGRWLRTAGPSLVPLGDREGTRYLAILKVRRRTAFIISPDFAVQRVDLTAIAVALRAPLEATAAPAADNLLRRSRVPHRRRRAARQAIMLDGLGPLPACTCRTLRIPPGRSAWRQLVGARLPVRLTQLCVVHLCYYLLWVASWWLIGRAVLAGRLEWSWMMAWGLMLLTLVPLQGYVTWAQGGIALDAGWLLKRRLLYGALKLEPEEIRHEGAGALLARVFEGDAVESLALSGGMVALLAGLELIISAFVLLAGPAPIAHLGLLVAWCGLAGLLGGLYFTRRQEWTRFRLRMTHHLVESIEGHRTRLAQQSPARWHEPEDREVERYAVLSRAMDRLAAVLHSGVSRGWLIAATIALAPSFVAGSASDARLAIALGGMLLAHQAFVKLTAGIAHLAGAAISWEQVRPLFDAAARREPPVALLTDVNTEGDLTQIPVLEAQDVAFRPPSRHEPVLRGCTLTIRAGDRVLLHGVSGAGKSTFGSILAGLRLPDAGLLLARGIDRPTLGLEAWRRRVAAAPQFHENHVLAETFAFNLLMGRGWPASAADLEEAESICRELGLGGLLEKMPAGLMQLVGETGWQLSHGERSRLYIARALLQKADLVILDESFAALDPQNLRQAVDCVVRRAPAVLAIAHP